MAYDDVLTRNDEGELSVRVVRTTEQSTIANPNDVYTRDEEGNLAVRVVGLGGNEHFLGSFATPQALAEAYPTAEAGDFAIVESTDTVWVWDSDESQWVDSDRKGQVTSVNGQTGAVTVQETLVNQTNIKSVNGNSLLGSGNLELSTYLPYPAGWTTDSTTKAFCDDIAADTAATVGKAYLGEVTLSDLPASMSNAEIVVEIMSGTTAANKVIVLTLTSGNTAPYMWKYTYWDGGQNVSGWKGFQQKLTAGSNITINGDTISATDTTYSVMTGASAVSAGTSGLTPQPLAGDEDKYLKGNGTWANAPVTSVNGSTGAISLSAEDIKAIPQVSSSADIDDLPDGSLFQYNGTTDANYTNGYFYKKESHYSYVVDWGNSEVLYNIEPEPSPFYPTFDLGVLLDRVGRTSEDMESYEGQDIYPTIGVSRHVANRIYYRIDNVDAEPIVAETTYDYGDTGKTLNQVLEEFGFTFAVDLVSNNFEGVTLELEYDGFQTSITRTNTQPAPTPAEIGAVTMTTPSTMPVLLANSWVSDSQTVNVTGVTASNNVFISPAPASATDYAEAGIICTVQGSGTLTFTCDTTPTNDITVNVTILN